MNLRISPITEADITGFHDCMDSVCREGRFLATLQGSPLEQTQEFVCRQIGDGNPMFVALVEGEVRGWCDVTPQRHPIHAHRGVLGMGVQAGFRSLGIGRHLLTAALDASRRRGLERVELTVRAGNVAAVKLYQSAGFEIEGTLRRAVKIEDRYEDSYSMALFLDQGGSPLPPP